MVLVFILLGIIIFILFILFIILVSSLKVEIKNLNLSNMKEKENINYCIKISLNLFGFLKWMGISIGERKVKKLISKIPKIDIKTVEKDFTLDNFKILKKLQIRLNSFKLDAILGVKSPVITAFIVAFVSSFISIILPHLANELNSKNYKYVIKPIYQNKNLYKISLNCIIELKMVHIINVIYILIKKGKSDKNERTASNRESYDYSYE